jgi:hypothetical protein
MRPILALLATATCAFAADPSISNGDMTAGIAVPTGWEKTWAGSGSFEPSRDATVFASAPASLKVVVSGDKANGNAHQEVQQAAGKRIRLTGKLRVDGAGLVAGIAIQAFDAQWQQILWQDVTRGQTAGATFVSFAGTADIPAGATRVLVCAHATGAGAFWLDDVEVSLAP